MDEKTLLRGKQSDMEKDYEVQLRKKALSSILAHVKAVVDSGSQLGENVGNNLTNCMTKFDDKKVRLRRAFSLEAISEHDGEEEEEGREVETSERGRKGFIVDPETGKRRFMRRYSFPMRDVDLATVPRAEFSAQLRDMQNTKLDDLDDNVYA